MLKAGISLNLKTIIAHPEVFDVNLDENNVNIGYPGKPETLCDIFEVEYTSSPREITPKLIYLGEIDKRYNTDYRYNDDSAIVYKAQEGLVVITGCSHSDIRNIIEHAKQVTKDNRIFALIGGLHLYNKTEYKIRELGIYLRDLNIQHFYPCHCCNLNSKIILSEYLKVNDVYSGLELTFN